MTIEDFEDDFKNGKIPECFDHVLIDGILTDEVIYEMASELQNEKLNVISLVCLISYFLEKSKNQLKESALRLSIMALRANNEGFNVEFFSNDIMQKFHQTLPMLPRYLQDDVVKLIAAFCNTKSYANFKYLHDLCKILKVEGYKFPKKAIKFDNSVY
ncbi:hypothetical protein MXB_3975 [Myxobolus squamalis]|nr:hypothetical protein MXB_3975 [Myxobolus squamalis]